MQKSMLTIEQCGENTYRTVFKNKHGRSIFLQVGLNGSTCRITNCFYTDRNQGKEGEARFGAKPKLLKTFEFNFEDLLPLIERDLDKHFFGAELVRNSTAELSLTKYLQQKLAPKKYRFLILVGDGKIVNGLPVRLRTRLKTKLHRSAYIELRYYKDGKGVVSQCYYYDRNYRRDDRKVTPPQLISCFFNYTKQDILNLINNEICCDFTHILITSDLDVDSDTKELCGAL